MSKYTTIVIRMPEDKQSKAKVKKALGLLEPFQTAMSIEDEMTVLELIENHEDFPEYIAEEARQKAAGLHEQARIGGFGGAEYPNPSDDSDEALDQRFQASVDDERT